MQREPDAFLAHPSLHFRHQRHVEFLTCGQTLQCWRAIDVAFDVEQRVDATLAARSIEAFYVLRSERVGLKDSTLGGQMGLGMFAAPVTRIMEQRRRGRSVAERPPVARIDPDAANIGVKQRAKLSRFQG